MHLDINWLKTNLSEFVRLQPFWHPLGFVSCRLQQTPELGARLHYWPKDDRRPKTPNWPIHTHIFDLGSTIITGSVRDRQYRCVEGNRHCIYEVQYNGIDSTISPTGEKVDIDIVHDVELETGARYEVEFGTFHETAVSLSVEALTLVSCFNFRDTCPLVMGQPGEKAYSYYREEFDRENFWQIVSASLEA